MTEYLIDGKDSGQRLDKYIARRIPLAPKSFIYKALRNKDIRLNGKKADGNQTVAEGDRILFRFPDAQFAELGGKKVQSDPGKNLQPGGKLNPCFGAILYEDENILLVDKRSGVLSQKAKPEDVSINEELLRYCGGRTDTFTPSVCNRLDRNTSGLIIFAKTYRGAREMSLALKGRSASKYYLAAVFGRISESGHLKARLLKSEIENKVMILPENAEEGDPVETAWRPLISGKYGEEDVTLLKVKLITGKTHQIRAHLAETGMPIVGDLKYGNSKNRATGGKAGGLPGFRLMLHSYELVLPGRGIFRTPVPEEFKGMFGEISEQLLCGEIYR